MGEQQTGAISAIVVVGGGAAGWLTAGLIAARHNRDGHRPLRVTLVESATIPIIGVGEGTWPTMGKTLQKLGLSERQFIQSCDVSLKQGTRFRGWVTGEAGDVFDHPFSEPHGFSQSNLYQSWQAQSGRTAFAKAVGLQPTLMDHARAPKTADMAEYAALEPYGYHLDAHKFATLLQAHCTQALGVNHVIADVSAVERGANGDIVALHSRDGLVVAGDLFVDCSGRTGLLIGETLGVPIVSCASSLFIDRALAVQVPYESPAAPIESATLSTAQPAGWIWDIGLSSRRGVGHVFSSAHTSSDAALKALRDYIRPRFPGVDALTPRELSFAPGYRERFWVNNCVAIGMAAGFVEPLEASALVMVELAAATLSEHLPVHRDGMDTVAKLYNERFRYRWERVVDFLKLHYVLSKRPEPFWRDNRDPITISPNLSDQLRLWRHQSPVNNGMFSPLDLFPAASHQYILYGMGFVTAANPLENSGRLLQIAKESLEEVEQRRDQISSRLPTNRELISTINAEDLSAEVDVEDHLSDAWVDIADEDVESLSKTYPIFFRRDRRYDRFGCVALIGLRRGQALLSPPPLPVDAPLLAPFSHLAERLSHLGLIEPVRLTFRDNGGAGRQRTVKGLHAVNWQRLSALKTGTLTATERERVDHHLASTRNVSRLIKLADGHAASEGSPDQDAPALANA